MTKPQSPFGLRLPPELRAKIAARAQANGRSLNGEISFILKDALMADLEKQRTPDPHGARGKLRNLKGERR
ncbi:MAG TPA: Arc family DNA-binding protein [Roseiarcus sp.]|jgi:hypothetical protein|nr:Arc family DNA-binding protein [Roseiarcus sp.]